MTRVGQYVFLLLCFVSIPTRGIPAQSSDDVVQVAGRAAAFVNPRISGPVTAAIVYEAGNASSESEARSIEQSLGRNLNVGSMTLRPRRVASHSLGQLDGAKIAFVTRGTNYRQVGAATAARSILSISFDSACTQTGHCVLAVNSGARVQIIVSSAATKAAGLRFNSSFLMLIKEI